MKECVKCHHCYDDSVITCEFDDKPLMTTIMGDVVISGRYILEKRLGNGGMGIVFKAKHKFLKSSFAVKIILPSLVEQDKNLLTRFKQEAILAASIDHPNVVRVTDFGVEDNSLPYLVMEFVDGTPLSDFLEPNKPLTLKNALELFQPIALGVAEAHQKGIIHRDLKPQNIMVQKNIPLRKGVKVLDFGLAKIKSTESFGSLVQTQTRNIMGSPPYMSPEQWENAQVDHRTDIYALGVILYQMLTGNLPFKGDSIPSVMYQHLTAQMPAFSTYDISLSPEIEAVIRRALEKDRQNRPASVEEMLGDFENAVLSSGAMSGNITEFLQVRRINETDAQADVTHDVTQKLTDSQRDKLTEYFSSKAPVGKLADEKLAHDFLQAKDRAEEAKAQANQADRLVQELAEAQKEAQEAQNKALAAKQRIEYEVRRQLEVEMEDKFALQEQKRQKAEAARLEQEIEGRKKAEERANYLAQAALEAQNAAEIERKKNEETARQREMHESVRREIENEAQQLTMQVAEAKKQFEEARRQSEYEARLRQQAEEKRMKIERDLDFIAQNEEERRRQITAQAQKQIEEQAHRFEKEFTEAQKRIEEARLLAEFEQQKREQAEMMQKSAEAQARQLGEEILKVQKRMEEIEKSIEPHFSAARFSSPDLTFSSSISDTEQKTAPIINFAEKSADNLPQTAIFPRSTIEIPTAEPSNPTFSGLLNTNSTQKQRSPIPLIAGGTAFLLLFALTGFGLFKYFGSSSVGNNPPIVNKSGNGTNASNPPVKKDDFVFIQGNSFEMGRNDVPDKNDPEWGNQVPVHTVMLSAFMIGKTEVSNREYAEFVKAMSYQTPKHWVNGKPPEGEENRPVVNVSLADAKAYAEWFSKRENKQCRLPTEEEWEFVARNGAKPTVYPWGDEWNEGFANLMSGKAIDVGTSRDETSSGVKDLMGNVSEWTSTIYDLYPKHGGVITEKKDKIVIRGSYYSEADDVLKNKTWITTRRVPMEPESKVFELGFRLVCLP